MWPVCTVAFDNMATACTAAIDSMASTATACTAPIDNMASMATARAFQSPKTSQDRASLSNKV